MLKNYLKTAWRNLVHNPLFSIIKIGSLSLATAATVLMLMWITNELSFDRYHPQSENIYLLESHWKTGNSESWKLENSFYPLSDVIKRELPEVRGAVRMHKIPDNEMTLTVNGNRYGQNVAIRVDPDWFGFFSYEFLYGKPSNFAENPYSIVITEELSRKLFGKANVVGCDIGIDSNTFRVAGVIANNPINSSFQFSAILPLVSTPETIDWLYLRSKTFVRLQPNADVNQARMKINHIIHNNSKAEGEITASLLPLRSLHFATGFQFSAFPHSRQRSVFIFGALALLVLLAATANYVNLFIAHITTRSREIGIRKINGASRLSLFGQIMTEAFVTSLLSLAVTILLVFIANPLLREFSGLPFEFSMMSMRSVAILAGVLLTIVLLTGVYPGVMISSFKPFAFLQSRPIFGIKKHALMRVLVVFQFTFAVVIMVAAIVIYRQFSFLQLQNEAYDRAQVFTAKIPSAAFPFSKPGMEQKRETTLGALKQSLLSESSIQAVARANISSIVNENFFISGGLSWEGKPENFDPQYISYGVDPDMIDILHFEIKDGRWFDKTRTSDKQNVILNETAVRKFGIEQPVVGRSFNNGTIIGVVKDFFHQDLHNKIGPLVIQIDGPLAATLVIQSKAKKAGEALSQTKKLWAKYFPGETFNYSFTDKEFDDLYRNDQKALLFSLIFSGLAICISCMGLLGIAILSMLRREKEIGIRKILGATVISIAAVLISDFMKLIVLSFLIAVPIASYAMENWLDDFAYRTSIGSGVFILAGGITLLIALAVVGFQTLKAAMANPVKSLRTE